MIAGAGGNIAVYPGETGTFVVDAGMPEFADQVHATIQQIAADSGLDPTVRFLVNTHWHFDHTGGNPTFGDAGATVVAHEGVQRLVSEDQVMEILNQRAVAALDPAGRPTLSFNERMNLTWDEDLIHLVHLPLAHSNGDVVVHFRDADIIHMGDIFFNGRYPFIDVDNGGNIEGMVRAIEEVLAHSRPTTLFIPGHGPLADRSDLEAYLSVLRTVKDRVLEMIEKGLSKDEIIAARPTAEFDEGWGAASGFTAPDNWVGLVYEGIMRAR
jgi:glyoxylase-like metal-dependent hydrolase (beta-lactamase superfamily II)